MDCWLECMNCGASYPLDEVRYECDRCVGLLDLQRDLKALPGQAAKAFFEGRRSAWQGPDASGVWRYRELVLPASEHEIVTRPEGNTPLYRSQRLSDWAGVADLQFKHEGENPTGSFKDRGMTVGVTQARRLGCRAAACASTGNTSASLAAYGALAGMQVWVFVPEGKIAMGKLAQAMAYGARTLQIRGDFDAAMTLVRQVCDASGVYLLNSVNPFRIEGQKSIVFEMLQQRAWQPPDWIVLPAGNLGNTSAFGKALVELMQLGIIEKMPRLACVQAAGANPFYLSYRDGFRARHQVAAHTLATAIRIGNPVSHERAVRALRWTDGLVTEVTDQEIMDAKAAIDAAGIGCEPASASTLAGIRKLAAEGVIGRQESIVAVLTGHLLKDPEATIAYHLGQLEGITSDSLAAPVVVDATLDAVQRVLGA